jgi:hypothetical protein
LNFSLASIVQSAHFSSNTMSKYSASTRSVSRRDFLKTTVIGSTALALPLIFPSRLLGADAPSNRIRVGQVGCGRIATVHDMPGVLNSGLADIVAVCDLDSKRATIMQAYQLSR